MPDLSMKPPGEYFTIYVDGASQGNPGPAGVGVVIKDASGMTRREICRYIGETTNNQAEYKAIIWGLREAASLGANQVEVKMDSELVVKQLHGSYKVRNASLRPLFCQATQLLKGFNSATLEHIPRQQNAAADALAKRAVRERGKIESSGTTGLPSLSECGC